MTNLNALNALRSTTCACGKSKPELRSFCWGCYHKLPPPARRSLYKRIFAGYLEAYEVALKLLGLHQH
jgi:hypothetical protein